MNDNAGVTRDYGALSDRAKWHAVRHATSGEWDMVQIHLDQAQMFIQEGIKQELRRIYKEMGG